jgi:hypothetical protein
MTVPASSREIRESASELKFFLDTGTAARLLDRARRLLSPDPYAEGPSTDEYTTTTLYFDSRDFSVYRRNGSYGRAKYRVRRYGQGDVVFLERKLRTAEFVTKRRTLVPIEDLPLLTAPTPDLAWSGRWFHERLLMRRLAAVCQIAYRRTARVGMTDYGPIRLTLDRELRGLAVGAPEFLSAGGAVPLADRTILELKFRGAMPAIFKQLVEEFALRPGRLSKYRLGIEATRPDVAREARRELVVNQETFNA